MSEFKTELLPVDQRWSDEAQTLVSKRLAQLGTIGITQHTLNEIGAVAMNLLRYNPNDKSSLSAGWIPAKENHREYLRKHVHRIFEQLKDPEGFNYLYRTQQMKISQRNKVNMAKSGFELPKTRKVVRQAVQKPADIRQVEKNLKEYRSPTQSAIDKLSWFPLGNFPKNETPRLLYSEIFEQYVDNRHNILTKTTFPIETYQTILHMIDSFFTFPYARRIHNVEKDYLVLSKVNCNRSIEFDNIMLGRMFKYYCFVQDHDLDNFFQYLAARVCLMTNAANIVAFLSGCGIVDKKPEVISIDAVVGCKDAALTQMNAEERHLEKQKEIFDEFGNDEETRRLQKLRNEKLIVKDINIKSKTHLSEIRGQLYSFMTSNTSRFRTNFYVQQLDKKLVEFNYISPLGYHSTIRELIEYTYVFNPKKVNKIAGSHFLNADISAFKNNITNIVNNGGTPVVFLERRTRKFGAKAPQTYYTLSVRNHKMEGNGLCSIQAILTYSFFNNADGHDAAHEMLYAKNQSQQLHILKKYKIQHIVIGDPDQIKLRPNVILCHPHQFHMTYIRDGCKYEWDGRRIETDCYFNNCDHKQRELNSIFGSNETKEEKDNKRKAGKRKEAKHKKELIPVNDETQKFYARRDAYVEKYNVFKETMTSGHGFCRDIPEMRNHLPLKITPADTLDTLTENCKQLERKFEQWMLEIDNMAIVPGRIPSPYRRIATQIPVAELAKSNIFEAPKKISSPQVKKENNKKISFKPSCEINSVIPPQPLPEGRDFDFESFLSSGPSPRKLEESSIPQLFKIVDVAKSHKQKEQQGKKSNSKPSTAGLKDSKESKKFVMPEKERFEGIFGEYAKAPYGRAEELKVYQCNDRFHNSTVEERTFIIPSAKHFPTNIILDYRYKKYLPRVRGVLIVFDETTSTPELKEEFKTIYCDISGIDPVDFVEPEHFLECPLSLEIMPMCDSITPAAPEEKAEAFKDRISRLRERARIAGGDCVSMRADVLFNKALPREMESREYTFIENDGNQYIYRYTQLSHHTQSNDIKSGVTQVSDKMDVNFEVYTIKLEIYQVMNYFFMNANNLKSEHVFKTTCNVLFTEPSTSSTTAKAYYASLARFGTYVQNNINENPNPELAYILLMQPGVYKKNNEGVWNILGVTETINFKEENCLGLLKLWQRFKSESLLMPQRYSNLSDIGILSLASWGVSTLISAKLGHIGPANCYQYLPLHNIATICGLPITAAALKLGLHNIPLTARYIPFLIPVEYVTSRYFMAKGQGHPMPLSTKLALSMAVSAPFPLSRFKDSGILPPMFFRPYATRAFLHPHMHHALQEQSSNYFKYLAAAPIIEEVVKSIHYVVPTVFAIAEHILYINTNRESNIFWRITGHNVFSLPTHLMSAFGVRDHRIRYAGLAIGMLLHSCMNCLFVHETYFNNALTAYGVNAQPLPEPSQLNSGMEVQT